jgi:exopolysaccharide biosynthesis polyprenyl glycosylphosphotransferase
MWKLIIKRYIDVVGAGIGLMLTGLVSVVVAPLIYIESPGPIFFSQNRVGQNGRIFKCFKFRSMFADAEQRKKELMAKNEMKGFMFKMTNDPRITRIGKFIRATSIDELPQFWNVLKGEMSLVGTRPPTIDEVKNYSTSHHKRLCIKPGLTGMWQVSGRSSIRDFEDVVKLDTHYIDNWSLSLDLKLILKTFRVVVVRSGAH